MNLIEDCTVEMLDNLTYDDIVNLKKSGAIDNFPDDKLHDVLSKKLLGKMMKQYSAEYKNENLSSEEKKDRIFRFCFSSLLSELAYDINLSSDQINKMVSVLTNEQLEKVSTKLDKNPNCWY